MKKLITQAKKLAQQIEKQYMLLDGEDDNFFRTYHDDMKIQSDCAWDVVAEMDIILERQAVSIQPKSSPKPPANKPAVKIAAEKTKSTRGRKSVKEMSEGVALIEVPEDDVLFQKMYYTIGKVADMFKVNQSLIRLWENEFDVLKPKKNGKGDRLFRPEDIKNIQLIYHLMRERKYTMEGAKDFIKNNKKSTEKFSTIQSLKKLKEFLIEMKASL